MNQMMETTETLVRALTNARVFDELDDADLEAVASFMTYREFRKDTSLPKHNCEGELMYVVVSGRVKATITAASGKELTLGYVDGPDFLFDAYGQQGDARFLELVAMSDVSALSFNASDLELLITAHPQLPLHLLSGLSRRLREVTARLKDMAFHDAMHRVKRVLFNIAAASYESTGVPVVEGFTHYEIAALAGTSRETASRVISKLTRDGLVGVRDRKIIVDLIAVNGVLSERDRTE